LRETLNRSRVDTWIGRTVSAAPSWLEQRLLATLRCDSRKIAWLCGVLATRVCWIRARDRPFERRFALISKLQQARIGDEGRSVCHRLRGLVTGCPSTEL
jgi:hypothetical protein